MIVVFVVDGDIFTIIFDVVVIVVVEVVIVLVVVVINFVAADNDDDIDVVVDNVVDVIDVVDVVSHFSFFFLFGLVYISPEKMMLWCFKVCCSSYFSSLEFRCFCSFCYFY